MMKNRTKSNRFQWLQPEIDALDLTGRDELYTHLLTQEIPFWIDELKNGKKISSEEVSSLIKRRGFNNEESVKLRKLVSLLNSNRNKIVLSFKDLKLSLKDFMKEIESELRYYNDKVMFKEQWLEIVRKIRR